MLNRSETNSETNTHNQIRTNINERRSITQYELHEIQPII